MTKNSLDSGIGVEVIHDLENTIRLIVERTNAVKEGLDFFADQTWPRLVIETEPIRRAYIDLKKRGVRIRFITEITAENISYCKEWMKFAEVRHLDGIVVGGWGVSESDYIAPIPSSSKGGPPTDCIHSNIKEVIELQQYVINSLWSKAIPAKQRIKEIEQGTKREFIESIRDPREIQKIGYDLIRGAEDEILILFSSENIFRSQGISEVFELLSEAASPPRSVKIRILVPARENEAASKFKELGIDIRQRKQQQEHRFHNKLTTLMVDQSYCLTVELKGDSKETFFEEAMGLATYSNSEPTVLASLAIFEQIWMQSEKHKDEERRAVS
ncbi:MAG: hypothetical protein ACREAY_05285 [Nitrososphaera sp.]|uniref:hypothetical protein n=1 Tax=Nitrososphaera sp. TaxID=1971748 RepID=UPI003D6F1BD5